MKTVRLFEFQLEQWESLATTETRARQDQVIARIRRFQPKPLHWSQPGDERAVEMIMLKAGDRDWVHVQVDTDGLFAFQMYLYAGNVDIRTSDIEEVIDLVNRYLNERHLAFFRSLVASKRGLTLLGSGWRGRLLGWFVRR